MIVLTREEAETILGPSPTHPQSALEPVPLRDGTYVLPDDVVDDPANADVEVFLVDHMVDGEPEEDMLFDMENPDDAAAYEAAKLTWSEGGQQRAAAAAARAEEE